MANKKVLTINEEASAKIDDAELVGRKLSIVQYVDPDTGNPVSNFDIEESSEYSPKEIFSDRASNIMGASASSGNRWFIVDPSPALTYDSLVVDPPPNPKASQLWTISFGGQSFTAGGVVKSLTVQSTFTPNLFGGTFGTLKAGHSITFCYDGDLRLWRCISINKVDS